MPALFTKLESGERRFELVKSVTSIGKDPQNDVRLDKIEPRHAHILRDKNDFRLFAMIEAGRGRPDDGFEVDAIARHVAGLRRSGIRDFFELVAKTDGVIDLIIPSNLVTIIFPQSVVFTYTFTFTFTPPIGGCCKRKR